MRTGRVVHYIEADRPPERGTRIRGLIDPARRRDHMQQHSGQHVLSAAFVRLFDIPTVSFHMGDDACSIDLDAPALGAGRLSKPRPSPIKSCRKIAPWKSSSSLKRTRSSSACASQRAPKRRVALDRYPRLRLVGMRRHARRKHRSDSAASFCVKTRECARAGAWSSCAASVRCERPGLTTPPWPKRLACFPAISGTFPSRCENPWKKFVFSRRPVNICSKSCLITGNSTALRNPESNGHKLVVRVYRERDLAFIKLLARS